MLPAENPVCLEDLQWGMIEQVQASAARSPSPEALRLEVERRIGCGLDTAERTRPQETFDGPIFVLNPTRSYPDQCRCGQAARCICPKFLEYGTPEFAVRPPKCLILIGESGAGKTTLINAIANAFFKVEFKDDYRLKADGSQLQGGSEANSQTTRATMYTFFPPRGGDVDFAVCVLDTMGLGSTGGLEQDRKVIENVSFALSRGAVDAAPPQGSLHAVGLVHTVAHSRLTPTQKYIFHSLLSLFGRDVKPAVVPIFTFAEGFSVDEEPPCCDSFRAEEIAFTKFVPIGNGSLYKGRRGSSALRQRLTFEESMGSCLDLCGHLSNKVPVTLEMTRTVLETRRHLEIAIGARLRMIDTCRDVMAALNQSFGDGEAPGGGDHNVDHNVDHNGDNGGQHAVKLRELSALIMREFGVNAPDKDACIRAIRDILAQFEVCQAELAANQETVLADMTGLNELAFRPHLRNVPEFIDILIESEVQFRTAGYLRRVQFLEDTKRDIQVGIDAWDNVNPLNGELEEWFRRARGVMTSLEEQQRQQGQGEGFPWGQVLDYLGRVVLNILVARVTDHAAGYASERWVTMRSRR